MTADDERPPSSVLLRRALLPALMLGLYFAVFDAVGTLLAKLVVAGYARDPWELARRLVADVLAGGLLVPAGLAEQRLRRHPRAWARDVVSGVAVSLVTAPAILVAAVGATYASARRGAGFDPRVLEAAWNTFAPVLPELAVGLVALALPAGVNVVARVRGVRLRGQVALSAAAGGVMIGTYALLVPGLLAAIGFQVRLTLVVYAAMLLVSALAPLLLAGADAVERRLAGARPYPPRG